ncbi:MAG: GtrA family protein [Oscillospiraceae bacterium]|nr:GtrA family protein [Oscillospiraceae bacterium]
MQFIKFALVGASNSAVYLGVYYVLICNSATIPMALIGQSIAWALSVANSFVWNRKFVFEDSNEVWWRAMGKTFAGYSSCFFVSSLLTFIQLQLLGTPAAMVPIVNLPIMGPINFMMLKYWAFRNRDAAVAEDPCCEAELCIETA